MKHGSNYDFIRNEIQNFVIHKLPAPPANPIAGMVYFNTSAGVLKFYGCTVGGATPTWVDLGQVLTGDNIIALLNASASLIDDDNLSAAVNDALTKRHAHSNSTALDATQEAFTTILKNKLDGIATNANKYVHPANHPPSIITQDASNRFVTDAEKSTWNAKQNALGFTPVKNGSNTPEIQAGLESARPAATGSGILYFAIDTKKIWKDTATGVWTQMGGQDLPIASSSVLGGIKVGANLTIGGDGTLNANDNPASFVIKHQRFTISGGQTAFTLTGGTYKPNSHTIFWFLDGIKQDSDALTESSATTFSVPAGLPNGAEILIEYYETINANPYPTHATEHISTGVDAIPNATATQNGLLSVADKLRLDGMADNANKYVHPANHPPSIITQDASNRFVTDAEKSTWNGKEPSITADLVTKFWSGTKTWRTLATDVRAVVLTGLSTATNAVIAATDSILVALGKLQAQITGHTGNTSNPHGVTKTQLTLGNVDNTSDANKPISTAQQSALNLKAPLASPALTGTPTAPTPPVGDNDTSIATTAFVAAEIASKLASNDAMIFKGTVGTGGTHTIAAFNALVIYNAGWAYKVIEAGTIKGKVCEVGDLLVATVDRASAGVDADWLVLQTNADGLVTGPALSTDGNLVLWNGATGKVVKNSAYSPASFAPAVHNHDTVYPKKYTTTIGGATSILVTHNLNTRALVWSIYDTATPWEAIITDVALTSLNTVTVSFGFAPAAGAYTIVLIG